MKQLTKAEEEIMQVLWELQIANVKEVITMLAEPKPAYNTVSTIIRILESKKFELITEEMKQAIQLYNQDDCFSTLHLHQWLEKEIGGTQI